MKKTLFLAAITAAALFFSSCRKSEEVNQENNPAGVSGKAEAAEAAAACQPGYYNLALDPSNGNSLIYKITGSPSAGPVLVVPVIGSMGDNIVRVGGVPVLKMSGLAVDPASGTAWGVTNGGNFPNQLIKFAIGDPNVASAAAIAPGCITNLNLSDIERDPATGRYYAINSSTTVAGNNRIVIINVGGFPSVTCLANTVPLGINLRGLTFDCNGRLFVMRMTGPNGRVYNVNTGTGLLGASCVYSGVISPGGVGAPEMGFHFDCGCINKFITGDFNNTLLTDGGAACFYPGAYASLPFSIRPTVDFAKP
ncbi:MAG: hypothetical protein JNM14_00485 [Ferruginibacter sp.]|nr:hypothetical protein [Ferruginibacter sp.]